MSSSKNEVQVDGSQDTPTWEEASEDVEPAIPIDVSLSQSTVTGSPDSMESIVFCFSEFLWERSVVLYVLLCSVM